MKIKSAPVRTIGAFIAIVALLASAAGCGRKHKRAQIPGAASGKGTTNKITAVPVGYTEEGVASWYGVPYDGRPAADGEIYDMETLVAAHRLLPFNTWLRVTNLANDKYVDVRVIDRGPFARGRILDLSKAAARRIDLIGPGTGRVRFEVIAAPQDVATNDFYAVQIGAFSIYENAERVRREYASRFGAAQLALKQGATPLWRVLVGKEPTVAEAQELAGTLASENKAVFVVRLDESVRDAGPAGAAPSLPPAASVAQPQ